MVGETWTLKLNCLDLRSSSAFLTTVALSKPLDLSVTQFPHLVNGDDGVMKIIRLNTYKMF